MNRLVCLVLSVVWLVVPGGSALAATFVVGTIASRQIVADAPEGWTAAAPQASSPSASTVRLTLGKGPEASLLVSVMLPPPDSPMRGPGEAQVNELATHFADRASAQSVEGKLQLQPFEAGEVKGAYFSATDKAPPPGEFKYISEGVAAFGEALVTFTVLSHDDPAGARAAMLAVVGSMHEAATP